MGSGSFGGGGGSGYTGQGIGGGYRFKNGKPVSSGSSLSKMEKEMLTIRRRLPKDYVLKVFGSPMIRMIYEQLFELSVHVFQNRSWSGITKRFGVSAGPGCLIRWVGAVISAAKATENNSKVWPMADLAVADFLTTAMMNNPDLYVSASDAEVLKVINKGVFDSTSAFFLGCLIRHVMKHELESIPETTEQQLNKIAQGLADKIVLSFEDKFHAKGQTTYRDLFRIIQEQPDWILNQLRQ